MTVSFGARWRSASLSRLFSPAGFGLVLLLFLLPFVGVSCDAQELGSVEVSYSGLDLAAGADPSVTVIGDFGGEPPTRAQVAEVAPEPGAQALWIATVALLVIGLAVTLIPVVGSRRLVGAGVAALAGIQLVITEVVTHGNLKDAVRARFSEIGPELTGESEMTADEGMLNEMVGTRFGFWLALVVLILLAAFTTALARADKQRPPPPFGQ